MHESVIAYISAHFLVEFILSDFSHFILIVYFQSLSIGSETSTFRFSTQKIRTICVVSCCLEGVYCQDKKVWIYTCNKRREKMCTRWLDGTCIFNTSIFKIAFKHWENSDGWHVFRSYSMDFMYVVLIKRDWTITSFSTVNLQLWHMEIVSIYVQLYVHFMWAVLWFVHKTYWHVDSNDNIQ